MRHHLPRRKNLMHLSHDQETNWVLLDPRVKKLLRAKRPIGVTSDTAYVNILLQQYLPAQPDRLDD